jgi:hypothetical protein
MSEEEEAAQAASQIPEADRVAYYQLATAAGTLRVNAAVVSHGDIGEPARGELRGATQRVRQAKPEDEDLLRIRHGVLDLLGREMQSGFDRRAARDVLDRLLVVHAMLDAYVRDHPVAGALVPD